MKKRIMPNRESPRSEENGLRIKEKKTNIAGEHSQQYNATVRQMVGSSY